MEEVVEVEVVEVVEEEIVEVAEEEEIFRPGLIFVPTSPLQSCHA